MQRVDLVISREQIHLVLRRQRTRLIAPCASADEIPTVGRGTVIALQPAAGRPATCRVTVLDTPQRILLGELDDEHARALGRRDIEDLMEAWVAAHGLWNENALAWLIPIAIDHSARSRFLHRDSVKAYTSSPAEALRGEKEAVDDGELERASLAADRAEKQRFASDLARQRALPAPERLQRAIDDAQSRGANVDHALFLVGKQLDALDRIVYAPADRTRDAEVNAPDVDRPARPARRLNHDAAERRRRERMSRAPGPLNVRYVDPEMLQPGQPIPRIDV